MILACRSLLAFLDGLAEFFQCLGSFSPHFIKLLGCFGFQFLQLFLKAFQLAIDGLLAPCLVVGTETSRISKCQRLGARVFGNPVEEEARIPLAYGRLSNWQT